MPPDIVSLRQERAKEFEKFQALAGQAGVRELTAEEQAEFDRLEKGIQSLDGRIKTAERLQALRAETAIPAPQQVDQPGARTVPATPVVHEGDGIDAARYVRAVANARGNLEGARTWATAQFGESHPVVADIGAAMQGNQMAEGGVFIPERLSSQLIALLYPRTVMRRISRMVPLTGGTDTIPTVEKGVNAYYIGEGEDIGTDEPRFGALGFKEREIASLVPISNKLLRLASVGVDIYVRDMLVEGFAQAEDTAFLRGTGTGPSPKGLRYLIPESNLVDATASTTPTAVQIDSDSRKLLLKLSTAEIPMINPRWLMHDRIFLYLQDLRDANGSKVYPGLERDIPTFRTYPVERFNKIPTNLSDGSNSDCSEIYFGDFSFSMVAESYGLRVDSNEAASYKVGNEMVSAYSRNQTLIRGLAGHDYGVGRKTAFAMLNKVRWGA